MFPITFLHPKKSTIGFFLGNEDRSKIVLCLVASLSIGQMYHTLFNYSPVMNTQIVSIVFAITNNKQ